VLLRRHGDAFKYASLSITSCARNARSIFDGARPSSMAGVGPTSAFSQINVTIGKSANFASAAV
jgi:hypothetical protein